MSSCSSSQCSFEAFEPRQSLWKLVEEFLPAEEQREIKEILGEDIIDETADLHREVSALLEIWQGYRDESEKKSRELFVNSHYQRLPEPPEMRGNLKKEIQLFVTALRQRSVEDGSIESLPLSKREKGIVDYAFQKTGSKEAKSLPTRPATALSSESGRSTPCRPSSSRSESRSSSSLTDVMESFQEQLNIQDVDQLADRLRNILNEEKNLLLEDITFLQNSLFEESHFMDNIEDNCEEEPSLQELKELGMKLEKEMMLKGTQTPLLRNCSYSSPPRRPARPRYIVRSLSSPNTMLETSKASRLNNKNPPATSPPRLQVESSSSALPAPSISRRSTLESNSLPTSDMLPSPPTSALSKRTGSESLSPSPPTSAALRRPAPASRFRKMVLDARHGEC